MPQRTSEQAGDTCVPISRSALTSESTRGAARDSGSARRGESRGQRACEAVTSRGGCSRWRAQCADRRPELRELARQRAAQPIAPQVEPVGERGREASDLRRHGAAERVGSQPEVLQARELPQLGWQRAAQPVAVERQRLHRAEAADRRRQRARELTCVQAQVGVEIVEAVTVDVAAEETAAGRKGARPADLPAVEVERRL